MTFTHPAMEIQSVWKKFALGLVPHMSLISHCLESEILKACRNLVRGLAKHAKVLWDGVQQSEGLT